MVVRVPRCFALKFRDSEPSVAFASVCFFAFCFRNTFYFCCRKNRRVWVRTYRKQKELSTRLSSFCLVHLRVFDDLRRILFTQNPGPLHIAKQYPAFCVGIPTHRTKAEDFKHTNRTLAASESVALVYSVYSYYEGLAKAKTLYKAKNNQVQWCTSRDSNPGPTD